MLDIHEVFATYFESDPEVRKIAYALSHELENGGICIDESLHSPPSTQSNFISEAFDENKPIIRWNKKYYLHKYFHYESDVLRGIEELTVSGNEVLTKRRQELNSISTLVEKIVSQYDNDQSLLQVEAALRAFMQSFSVFSGGPGTGKTTSIKLLLYFLFHIDPEMTVAVLTPTGKAASRINESLRSASHLKLENQSLFSEYIENIEADTIHRYLASKKRSPQNLDADFVIVDESSMIDISLMSKLMKSIKTTARLVLIGDRHQLASVEAGSAFSDICEALQSQSPIHLHQGHNLPNFLENDQANYTELQKSFRFDQDSGIANLASDVLKGKAGTADSYLGAKDIHFENEPGGPRFEQMVNRFSAFIKTESISEALDALNQVKVLCALKSGPFGVDRMNKTIEALLVNRGLIDNNHTAYHNQPILIRSNNYELGLFNGDQGLLRFNTEGRLTAYFMNAEGDTMEYPAAIIPQYETSFALTIHKSQGSEYYSVALVLPNDAESAILSRQLLYTGITRAKKELLIIASDAVLQQSAARNAKKATGIHERLNP